MLPITSIPQTIAAGLAKFRGVFCRAEGFEHVSRYVSGLLLSPNKTLQAIYDLQVWPDQAKPSRRAMHEAVFEAGWDDAELIAQHRAAVASDYRGQGRSVICLDWTLCHHERGPQIFAVTKAYDYIAHRTGRFQTVITAVVANQQLIDGLAVIAQAPVNLAEEEAYLKATVQQSYDQMAAVQQRLLELLHYYQHQQQYRKRTEIVVEVVRQLEAEGQFPQADYAFDLGG